MRNAFVCISLALICSVTLTDSARAAERANLVGVLRDPETRQPMNGVELALVDPGEHHTTTGAEGRFNFKNIPVGTYRFLFAYLGGEEGIRRSMLLAKNIEVTQLSDALALFRQPLLEHPEDRTPHVAEFQFSDGRARGFNEPRIFREPLGHRWPRQYVTFRYTFKPFQCQRRSLRVMDGNTGSEVPFQLSNVRLGRENHIRSCLITFPADLSPFERKMYIVCHDWQPGFMAPNYRTDLQVETDEATGQRVLSNSMMAVRLPSEGREQPVAADKCPAPVLALRGPDHVWFGRGRLVSDRIIDSFKCELTEDGPVFKQFEITYRIAAEEGETAEDTKPEALYRVALRLYAARDYLIMAERMSGDADLSFRFELGDKFDAETAAFARDGRPAFAPISPEAKEAKEAKTLALFRPWNPIGLRASHDWYGLMAPGDRKDAVGLVQIDGSAWAFRGRERWTDETWLTHSDAEDEVRLLQSGGRALRFEFPHRAGTREFAFAVFDKTKNWDAESLAAERPPGGKSHYLNRLHVQFSQIDLQGLADVQALKAKTAEHPRLLFNPTTFETLKKTFEADPTSIPPVLHDVFTGSRQHTAAIRRRILNTVEYLRRGFLGGASPKDLVGYNGRGTDPAQVKRYVTYAALLYDANVASGLFSDLEQEWMLGVLALVASRLEHPNYRLRFAHDPEQAAQIDSTLAVLSLLLSEHPRRSRWAYDAEQRMRGRLQRLAARGGVPADMGRTTRALSIWAGIAPVIESAAGTGRGESPFEWPGFVGALARLSGLTTPPDRRYGGVRLLPPLGRSQPGDRRSLAVLGEAARRTSTASPALAGQLAWAWEQAGSPRLLTGDLRYESLLQSFRAATDEVEPRPPADARSGPLPGFGALFRSEFGTPKEAYLLFKCSPSGGSTHHDQLALLFHAFGTPLLLDSPGRPATWAHNTVRIGSRTHAAGAQLTEFYGQEDHTYAVGRLRIRALSKLRECTAEEFRQLRAAATAEGGTFSPPAGHNPDGTQTAGLLSATDPLDEPVDVTRHVLFNKERQYALVLDRVKGRLPAEVFYNVLAADARLEGHTARLVGPYGVDLDIHAFGSGELETRLYESGADRWTFQLSPASAELAPADEKAEPAAEDAGGDETPEPGTGETETKPGAEPGTEATEGEKEETTEPPKEAAEETPEPGEKKLEKEEPALPEPETEAEEPPVVEYLSVLCPIRRGEPGDEDVEQYAAPAVEKLDGVSGARIRHGETTRYVFLAQTPTEYRGGGVTFKGKRAILTIRPTHFHVVLFDAGELRYKGRGVKTDHGTVQLRFVPGPFVDGQVSGRRDKVLTFFNLGRAPDDLAFRVDGSEYSGRGDEEEVRYGVRAELHRTPTGRHSISIRPE